MKLAAPKPGAVLVAEARVVGVVGGHAAGRQRERQAVDDARHDAHDERVDQRRDDQRRRVLAELVPRPGERVTDGAVRAGTGPTRISGRRVATGRRVAALRRRAVAEVAAPAVAGVATLRRRG